MARAFRAARADLQAALNAHAVNPAHYGFVPEREPRELHLIGGGMKRAVIVLARMEGETEDMARERLVGELIQQIGAR